MLKTVTNSINASQIQTPITLPGDVTLSTGNLVIGTSGKGIDFSATPGTGTSELLSDYEEGIWTPTLTTTGTDFTSVSYLSTTGGRYVKIGKIVHVQGFLRTSAVTVGSASGIPAIGGLPFAVVANGATANGSSAGSIAEVYSWVINNPLSMTVVQNTNLMYLLYRATSNGATDGLPIAAIGTGANANAIAFSAVYVCA